MGKRLLLGVSGSVHVVEIPRYLRMFREELGLDVTVVMTHAATKLMPSMTVAAYAGGPVHTDLWRDEPGAHVNLVRSADLFVVLPATADLLGKAANGIADDMLSTAILAAEAPIVFAPAMNAAMYRNPAVRRNIATLRADGHLLVPVRPTVAVADGDPSGGMAPVPHAVVSFLREVMSEQPLSMNSR